ncbi:MAG: family 2A encapsulin nanocompartment shell protein [Minicystis sp.]
MTTDDRAHFRADSNEPHLALGDRAAQKLANTTKTAPQMSAITPRWLIHMLPWVPVEAGTYRVNRVKDASRVLVGCDSVAEQDLTETFVDYEEKPREYVLGDVTTVLAVSTRVSDRYSSPHDQIKEQLRLTIEAVKERQESEIINNKDYGLLNNVHPSMRVASRTGAPSPDDLDELISRVWKEPGFFLAHPRAIAAFGRECTKRGVPPPTVTLFGSPFLTWRGIPLIPSDKLYIRGSGQAGGGTSDILLLRVGEKRQGVVGLYQPRLPGEQGPGLSVRFMGINRKAIASYLVSLYCSMAVLTEDALGVLENVEVGKYHDYR